MIQTTVNRVSYLKWRYATNNASAATSFLANKELSQTLSYRLNLGPTKMSTYQPSLAGHYVLTSNNHGDPCRLNRQIRASTAAAAQDLLQHTEEQSLIWMPGQNKFNANVIEEAKAERYYWPRVKNTTVEIGYELILSSRLKWWLDKNKIGGHKGWPMNNRSSRVHNAGLL